MFCNRLIYREIFMTSNDELRIEICRIDNSTLQNEVFLPIFAHFST